MDKDQLKALYGETPLKSVFSGAVMPPPEMEPLYTRLTSFVYVRSFSNCFNFSFSSYLMTP